MNDITLGLTAEQADSLQAEWRERQRQDAYSEFFKHYILEDSTAVVDQTPDSIYNAAACAIWRHRSSCLQFDRPGGYINRYIDPRSGTISRILGMSQYYFPIIESELLREGLPVELRALPIIESALSPTAVSPVGAVGLWQFMPTTGKSYGLEINSLGRRTPRSAPLHGGRLPLSEGSLRHLQRLDAGHCGLQLRPGQRQQGHGPFGRQDLLGDLQLPAA